MIIVLLLQIAELLPFLILSLWCYNDVYRTIPYGTMMADEKWVVLFCLVFRSLQKTVFDSKKKKFQLFTLLTLFEIGLSLVL